MRLSKKHAEKLFKESEQREEKRLRKLVEALNKQHREIKRLKREKLSEVKSRTAADVESRNQSEIERRAEILKRESTTLSNRYRHPKRSEIAKLSSGAPTTTQTFTKKQTSESAEQLLKLAKNINTLADFAAIQKSEKLGFPEDIQIQKLSQQFLESVKRALTQPNMKEFNDTRLAAPEDHPSIPENASPAELYKLARQLEQSIVEHYNDFRVGEMAINQNRSYNEARKNSQGIGLPKRSDLLSELAERKSALTQQSSKVSDLNAYRTSLRNARDQVASIHRRANSLLAQAAGIGGNKMETNALRVLLAQGAFQAQGESADLSKIMRAMHRQASGNGNSQWVDPTFHLQQEGGKQMAHVDRLPGVRIPRKRIFAEAMSGRRFSRNSKRQGWLYLDTWYLIGPWENHGRVDYTNIHPPEKGIDFDATYSGKNNRPLRWTYIQSNNIRVIPKPAPADSTWYAYTELFFEEPMDMLLAIASDDATKVWINGQVVWQENGLSQWRIGEGIRKVFFKKGTNKILLRAETDREKPFFPWLSVPQMPSNKNHNPTRQRGTPRIGRVPRSRFGL